MEQNPDPRVKVVVRKRDLTGEPIEEDSKTQAVKQEKSGNHAIILRKNVFNDKFMRYQLTDTSEIEILNIDLWNLLKEHLGHYPYHVFRDSPVTLKSPYEPIVFNFDVLSDVAKSPLTDESEAQKVAREDLQRLLDIISLGDSGDEDLDKYFKMRPNYKKPTQQTNQDPETIQFMDLWTVFPPGALIYGTPFQGEEQVFIVKDNIVTWPERSLPAGGRNYQPWELDAWMYDWKDGKFRRVDFKLLFEEFDGHLPLTSLPYYPFELHKDYSGMRKKLIRRGERFRSICTAKEDQRLFNYVGPAISEQKGFSGMKSGSEVSRVCMALRYGSKR